MTAPSEGAGGAGAQPPTLSDGVVTLRQASTRDAVRLYRGLDAAALADLGHSEPLDEDSADAEAEHWQQVWRAGDGASFLICTEDDAAVGLCAVRRRSYDPTSGRLSWVLLTEARGRGFATRAMRVLVDWALSAPRDGGLGLSRVEAEVASENTAAHRVATRAGLQREGFRRVVAGTGRHQEASGYVLLSRLASDPPLSDPASFRALLNSFLPRKRAISQLLVRDRDDRVLLCQLTYKPDWDLPGGVVEVGESPHLAAAREVTEELSLDLPAGELLLTDWLPPWSGWDDAVCLVFDGGRVDAEVLAQMVPQAREIRTAEFCTPAQVRERCRDFTARRIEAALERPDGPAYTESGLTPGR